MAKQKFRPTRPSGFSGVKAYIWYVEVLKKRCNAVGRTFCDAIILGSRDDEAVSEGTDDHPVREFSAFTDDLEQLKECDASDGNDPDIKPPHSMVFSDNLLVLIEPETQTP